jgi:hypothetical protein
MKRRSPWTVRMVDNSLFFKMEEFSLSKKMFFRVKAASMSSDRTCLCVYCVMNTMSRMVSMKVSAKSVRKGVEELLNRRRNVGKGGGVGGQCSGVGDDSRGAAVDEAVVSRVHKQMMAHEEIMAYDGS